MHPAKAVAIGSSYDVTVARVPLPGIGRAGPRAASGRETSGRHTAGQKTGSQVLSPGSLAFGRQGELQEKSRVWEATTRLCAAQILTREATVLYLVLHDLRRVVRVYLDLPPAAREIS
jgi:hypothetical protein